MGSNGRARGPSGRFIRTLDGAERDAEACRLKAQGLSYRAIAGQLGYSDAAGAYRAISKVLTDTVKEPADELRALELQRLDMLWAAAWEVLEREHVVVSNGEIVVDTRDEDGLVPDDEDGDQEEGAAGTPKGRPLLDDAPVLKAIETLRKLAERRAAMLGLDAPKKIEQGGQVRYEIVGVDPDALK